MGLAGLLATVGLATPSYATAAAENAFAPVPDRFMTWNTNGQGLGTSESVAEQIKSFRPQIAALQESCLNEVQEAVRQLNEAGLKYRYRSGLAALNAGCPGRLGTAIVYAEGTQIRAHNRKGYSEDEGWLEARGMQSFTTRVAGQSVRVFNTHLSAPGHERLRRLQVRELVNATRPHRRAMILGDLNTRPWVSNVMSPIWDAGFRDVDPFCGRVLDSRCNRTLPDTRDAKFDYILLRGGLNFSNCRLHTPTRDHRIVISELTLSQGPRPSCVVT
ncbi:endonuclease/exonuclease/phosphatase family protein [Actinomadura spongiicola]|uniref:Endonuclease/exonuclease/phosphatase family protein n=1 Tax=Actinomadura spongiicola TaxID=2303421 RepID=A0A372G7K2_9ACTN|nr:endonuclease/exonuclease/phosphatase family protein [Actinomadura spongiicola]